MQPLSDDIAEWCDETWGQNPLEVLEWFEDDEMVFNKNLNDLSEKIVRVARDEKLRKKIGKNGKNKLGCIGSPSRRYP